MELPVVPEGVGMIDVPEKLPLHGAIGEDPRGDALTEPLPQQKAPVGEPLKGIGVGIAAIAERRVANISQRTVEIVDAVGEGSGGNGGVDNGGIGDVVGRVLGKSGVKEQLRLL